MILKKIVLFFLSFFIVSFPSMASIASSTQDINKNEVIVEDVVDLNSQKGSVKMTFWVEAPLEKVWTLLVEYDRWIEFMPDLEKITIKEKNKNSAIVYIKAKTPMNLNIWYVIKRNYDKKNNKITWNFLEGKAKDVQGSWQIFPINKNLCKLVYVNYVDLGYGVPQNIVNLLTKNKLPNLANGIKKYLKNNIENL